MKLLSYIITTVLYCIYCIVPYLIMYHNPMKQNPLLPFVLILTPTKYMMYYVLVCMYVCMATHIAINSMNQPDKVANPARGQLNRENEYFPVRVCLRLRIWSRETSSAVPSRVPISILRLKLKRLLTGFLRVPRRRSFIYFTPPYAIGSVPSLSGHAISYRCRSLPRIHRHRASKPQGSSERGCLGRSPWTN